MPERRTENPIGRHVLASRDGCQLILGFALATSLPLIFATCASAQATNSDVVSDESTAGSSSSDNAAADEPTNAEGGRRASLGQGRLVRVRLPLTGNADAHFKSIIQRAVNELVGPEETVDGRRPILILELAPAGRTSSANAGEGSDFERALSLARFLTSRELRGVKTVAYIPRTIRGHGVLVALACEEIVMHTQAELGDAGVDESDQTGIDRAVLSGYEQISEARRTVPTAIALGMLDNSREVLKVETETGTEFVLREDLADIEQVRTVISTQVIVPSGSLGRFVGQQGREYGFVKYLADDRQAAAWALRLPIEALVEDQSLVGDWRPMMLTLQGPVTARNARRLKTLIGSELYRRKVNWIGVRIDSSGGEVESGLDLAHVLAGLDPTEVRTVAYLPVEATGVAALIALSCDQLVMHRSARLNGAKADDYDPETIATAKISIRDSLAREAEREWSLLVATLDVDQPVIQYRHRQHGVSRFYSPDEVAEQDDSKQWQKGETIKEQGEPLEMDGERAAQLGIAWETVENFDDFVQLYGFESPPPEVEPNKVLELVEALGAPGFAFMLLAIGMIGVYVELHTPGLGIGGFVAAVAFLLFFWSKGLQGTAEWLEVLLFVAGIFFLLMEILVLPGFGIFGLGGGAMIVASIILASQSFVLPRSESDLAELRTSLFVLVAAAVSVIAAALGMRRFLPHTPFFNKLLLAPPADEELDDLDDRESVADYAHLVGATGTAATNLMPAGKALVNHELIDVIADGDPIERGVAIEVIATRGNRVMVRAADV